MYRQNARPIPPEKFRLRLRDEAIKHPFSKHDNKQIFLNDPTLFSQGIGKKKVDSLNKGHWNPEFISWSIEAGKEPTHKKSIYQNDFCLTNNSNNNNRRAITPPKLLSGRSNASDNKLISSYSSNFSHGEPKLQTSLQIQSDNNNRFLSKQQRAKTCGGINSNKERLSVANCLVWHKPNFTTNNNNNITNNSNSQTTTITTTDNNLNLE